MRVQWRWLEVIAGALALPACTLLVSTADLHGTSAVTSDAGTEAQPVDDTSDATAERADGALDDDLMEGLVGYWPLDEGTGLLAADSSGNNHHATLLNGARWTTGLRGGGIAFALGGEHLDVPTLYDDAFPASGTLSLWTYGTYTSSGNGPIFENYDRTRMHLFLRKNGNVLQVAFQGETDYAFHRSLPPPANKWSHLVVVWDSQALRGALYVDGAAFEGTITPGWRPSAQRFRFGDWDGTIDEIRLWNRPLSAEEVRRIP